MVQAIYIQVFGRLNLKKQKQNRQKQLNLLKDQKQPEQLNRNITDKILSMLKLIIQHRLQI